MKSYMITFGSLVCCLAAMGSKTELSHDKWHSQSSSIAGRTLPAVHPSQLPQYQGYRWVRVWEDVANNRWHWQTKASAQLAFDDETETDVLYDLAWWERFDGQKADNRNWAAFYRSEPAEVIRDSDRISAYCQWTCEERYSQLRWWNDNTCPGSSNCSSPEMKCSGGYMGQVRTTECH